MCEALSGIETPEPDAPRLIKRTPFEKLLAQLLKSKSKDRAKLRGLDDARKDQIVAGALLVGEIFRRLDIPEIQLCDSAMREGILLDYLNRHMPDLDVRREVPDPRRRSVIDLARRCHWHRVHSEQVARLTVQLFDETRAFHGMGTLERELIEYAALLHDIGWHIGRVDHHKHSAYLILNGSLRDFTRAEVAVIANIARYHRKGRPKKRHRRYAELSPRERRIVDVGAALLRVADGLDRSHSSVVQSLRVKLEKRTLRVLLSTRSDAELEVWGARRKRKLFEDVFNHAVAFELSRR
jgi:exopolyphosphatase/guanosine-5'-triphosphate,3'-diphosphate pyrophosphatase